MSKSNKIIYLIAAFMMITAAFLMPVTAYANEETDNETDEPIVTPDLSDANEAGWSGLLELVEMFKTEDIETETDSAVPDNSKAFTPDGQASVVDLAYEGDGKMFYTFKTPAGNVFYLIIDRERGTDNVYFLNAVTEADLIALAENGDGKSKASTSAIPVSEPPTGELKPDVTSEKPDNSTPEDDNSASKKKSNTGMIVFVVIGILAVGGLAVYMKIIRPKQQAGMGDGDDDAPDGDEGEEMEFEDEPKETDGDGDEYEYTADSDEDGDE
jgi:hypothetical protein